MRSKPTEYRPVRPAMIMPSIDLHRGGEEEIFCQNEPKKWIMLPCTRLPRFPVASFQLTHDCRPYIQLKLFMFW
jgi:hypothetical protein